MIRYSELAAFENLPTAIITDLTAALQAECRLLALFVLTYLFAVVGEAIFPGLIGLIGLF
jgi:hypothetical protein